MGFLDALVTSADRFKNEEVFRELGVGFDYRPINWIVELYPNSERLTLKGKYKKDEKIRCVPMRADRSGTITQNNIKPNLFVDNARYSLGLAEGTTTKDAFDSFKNLHVKALCTLKKWKESHQIAATDFEQAEQEIETILNFLKLLPEQRKKLLEQPSQEEPVQDNNNKGKKQLPDPKDVIAFTVRPERFPFDEENGFARAFWKEHLQKECSSEEGTCSACGLKKPLLRILPFKLRLFGERCPVLSVNTDEQQSFGSLGKGQLGNSPICMECAGKADRLIKFLTQLEKDNEGKEKSSGRHAVVLARDARQSLGNQIAVFWTKEQIEIKADDGANRSFEDIAKAPIEDFDDIPEDAAPVQAGQCKKIIGMPFFGGQGAPVLPTNRFYLAVLSPNKSRLVVREWLETDIAPVQENIARYIEALEIIHPDGRGVWWPPLQTLLKALCSYTSAKKEYDEKPRLQIGPDVTRKLIRCIYTGTPPPEALLAQAVRCFRVPDPPTEDRKQRERQMLRRMAMAAAMKLVLTYQNEKEAKAMVELKPKDKPDSKYKEEAPYNCGVLLAILEETQRRASSSGRGVNATLVDRFYGAASTAPVTVFSNLISMATKAHLPKLRRENKEFFKVRSQAESININDLIEEACRAINAAGGFPAVLKMSEQAEFALGFYHQRAEFNTPRTPASNKGPNNTKQGGQS